MPTWADNKPNNPQKNDACYFYEYMRNSSELSDPANQISSFIKNHWIVLEHDLVNGQGEQLTYLRGLAMCHFVVPEKFWETHLKGLPYEDRATTFKKLFSSKCLCTWK